MVHLLVVLKDQPPPDAVRHPADVLPDALHGRVFVAVSSTPVDNQNGILHTKQAICNFSPSSLPEEVYSFSVLPWCAPLSLLCRPGTKRDMYNIGTFLLRFCVRYSFRRAELREHGQAHLMGMKTAQWYAEKKTDALRATEWEQSKACLRDENPVALIEPTYGKPDSTGIENQSPK
jgi:hypothetical protein